MSTVSSAVVLVDLASGGPAGAGFALDRIGPFVVVEHVVRRLRPLRLPVVVVADRDVVSPELEQRLRAIDADVERATAGDALSRAVDVASTRRADAIVRVPPGCVFIETAAASRLLDLSRRIRADYVVEGGLPSGTAVEIVTAEALSRASTLSTDAYDRAHVTSLIRRDRRFHAVRAVAPAALRRPGLCLAADSVEHIAFLRAVYEATNAGHLESETGPDLVEIVRAADAILIRSLADARRSRSTRATA